GSKVTPVILVCNASVAHFKQPPDSVHSAFQMGHNLLEYGKSLRTAGQQESRADGLNLTLPETA
ncbi:hypothetical protein E2320_001266, partial [Naja naja]